FKVKVLSAVSTLFFVASFATGLGAFPFMIATGVVGHPAVGGGQSISPTVNWLAPFTLGYGLPRLRAFMGNGNVFFVFSCTALVFFTFVSRFVPETKGKRSADEVWGITRRED